MSLSDVLSSLHAHGCNPQKNGDGYKALCPAHEDHNPSLSIKEVDGGRVCVKCFAGCPTPRIIEEIGLRMADLAPARTTTKSKGKIVATYDYRDADGVLLYQVVRFDPKGFSQRRPDGNGKWTWNLNGVRRVLYRLPELLTAPADSWVVAVEGEKDGDNLARAGIVATTSPQGAGKWDTVDDSPLHGKKVCVIADKDKPGRDHAADIVRSLYGKVASLKVIELPGDNVKDASDWIAAGGTKDELLRLIEAAPEPTPTEPDAESDPAADSGAPPPTDSKKSQADAIVALALDAGVDLFHGGGGADATAYAAIPVGDHVETHPVNAKGFRRWVARLFYEATGKAANTQSLQDAINVLAGKSLFDGVEHPVAVRLAEHGPAFYLDLCNTDWEVVKIDADGWTVISAVQCPVRFIRRRGMLPLPTPQPGGCVDDLKRFVNVGDDHQWTLLLAWLVAAMRPTGPYPILVVNGEQGSAKSTLFRILRLLIDPNKAAIRRPPRDERDLMIAASNSWLVPYDNLSGIPPWLSDAICVLATGGGFSTRELYSDDEEKLFDAQRPVAVNGIDDLATRPDMLDRAICLSLPTIAEDHRRDEKQLYTDFEKARPFILGGLLTAVSAAIRNVDSVKLNARPRMADFATWAVAAESALGVTDGAFMDAYSGNRSEATEAAIESSAVGPAIVGLMHGRTKPWEGTCRELLVELEAHHSDEATRRRRDWPRSPKALANILRRLAPALRAKAIEYTPPVKGTEGRRELGLEKVRKPSPLPPLPPLNAVPDTENADSCGDPSGDSGDTLFPPEEHRHSENSVCDTDNAESGDGGDSGDEIPTHSGDTGDETEPAGGLFPGASASVKREWYQ